MAERVAAVEPDAEEPDRAAVTLRDVVPQDLPVLFEHQRDPAAVAMAAFRTREREAFTAHWQRILADPSVAKQTILCGGRIAGNVVAFRQGDRHLVGYWVGREFWGQGVATRALLAFVELVTTRPLHAFVAKHNVGSIRVLEKCGFRLVGEQPQPADGSGDGVVELLFVLAAPPLAMRKP
jgi:RimJ/RimL family protein N-acetyltransferase